jgi:myo-inositol-1(or 4)-monophosphatase
LPGPDLALLTEAARTAGAIALLFWRQNPRVWEKPGEGPVTEADLAVNADLEQRLRGARPDYGWLSEEGPEDPGRLGAGRVFLIDPIDGTRAFIAGEENFAVSLAVAEAGRVVAAVVYLPAKDRLYTASVHGPALCDGQPIRASGQAGIAGARVLGTSPVFAAEHWPGGVPEVQRSFRASLAYRLCLVAEGRYDAMLTLRDTWEWDIAAGALIAERAGATVTNGRGVDLVFNAARPKVEGVIAGAAGLHADLMRRRLPQGLRDAG